MREGEWKSGREMNGVNKNLQQYSNLQDIRIDLFKEKVCVYICIYVHAYIHPFKHTHMHSYIHA